jgi:DNA primase
MDIQEFEKKLDIVEVVREYIPTLRRTGRNYKALCPFHKEKTPSFIVSPEKNIFHCFGCDVGGGAIRFVQLIENIPRSKAIEKLAQRYKIDIKGLSEAGAQHPGSDKEKYLFREKLYKICELAADFYHNYLLDSVEGKEARQYLQERKINKDSVHKYKIGLAPKDGNCVLKLLCDEGFTEDDVKKAGLCMYSEKYNRYMAYFHNRIIFPIRNVEGRIIGFGGRTLQDDSSIPKYINTAETEIYFKSRSLYGLYEGRKSISESKSVFVVEGYIDVIVLQQEGIENVVSPLGTSLTEDQLYLLKRYCDEVILLFDSDEGGVAASLRAVDLAVSNNVRTKIVPLPEGSDPDEIILSKGRDCFMEEYVNKALDGIVFYVKFLEQKNSSLGAPWRKSNIVKELAPLVSKVKDEILRNEWIKWISEYLQIDHRLISKEVNKRIAKDTKYSLSQSEDTAEYLHLSLEEEVLAIFLNNEDLRKDIFESIFPDDFSTSQLQMLAQKIFDTYRNKNEVSYFAIEQSLYDGSDENGELISLLNKIVLCELSHEKHKLRLKVEEFKSRVAKKRNKKEYSILRGEVVKILNGEQPYDAEKIIKFNNELRKKISVGNKIME